MEILICACTNYWKVIVYVRKFGTALSFQQCSSLLGGVESMQISLLWSQTCTYSPFLLEQWNDHDEIVASLKLVKIRLYLQRDLQYQQLTSKGETPVFSEKNIASRQIYTLRPRSLNSLKIFPRPAFASSRFFFSFFWWWRKQHTRRDGERLPVGWWRKIATRFRHQRAQVFNKWCRIKDTYTLLLEVNST